MFSSYQQVCVFLREEIENHKKDWDQSTPRNFIDCYLSEIEKVLIATLLFNVLNVNMLRNHHALQV